jgi:putative endonuclease
MELEKEVEIYTVYILYSSSLEKYYIGQTNNFESRIHRHNSGHEKFTKSGLPWILIWKNEVSTRSLAMKLEKQIKKRGAKRYLEKLGV